MKEATKARIQARSTPAIAEGLEILLAKARTARVKRDGRVLSYEKMVNAIVLAFLDLPREKQFEALTAYVPIFEGQLEGEQEPEAEEVPVKRVKPKAKPKGKPA